jgi:hypothetical protein
VQPTLRLSLTPTRSLASLLFTHHPPTLLTTLHTGIALAELTAPYYQFLDAGMDVDVASLRGGGIPIDPQTLMWLIRCVTCVCWSRRSRCARECMC